MPYAALLLLPRSCPALRCTARWLAADLLPPAALARSGRLLTERKDHGNGLTECASGLRWPPGPPPPGKQKLTRENSLVSKNASNETPAEALMPKATVARMPRKLRVPRMFMPCVKRVDGPVRARPVCW